MFSQLSTKKQEHKITLEEIIQICNFFYIKLNFHVK